MPGFSLLALVAARRERGNPFLSELDARVTYLRGMKRDQALTILRQLRAPLEARGIAHAAIFGSVARGDETEMSDVDVIVTPAIGARLDLIDLGGVQTLLDEQFGTDVDVVVEPVKKPELRRTIQRDRADAF